jgi:hypothetical protein
MQPKSPEKLFEQQVAAATNLVEAKKKRVALPHDIEEKNNEMYAGSALTAEYSDEDMAALKEADEDLARALSEFDEITPDRNAFIKLLEEGGKKDLAKSVARAIEIHKDNVIQRLIRKVAA